MNPIQLKWIFYGMFSFFFIFWYAVISHGQFGFWRSDKSCFEFKNLIKVTVRDTTHKWQGWRGRIGIPMYNLTPCRFALYEPYPSSQFSFIFVLVLHLSHCLTDHCSFSLASRYTVRLIWQFVFLLIYILYPHLFSSHVCFRLLTTHFSIQLSFIISGSLCSLFCIFVVFLLLIDI